MSDSEIHRHDAPHQVTMKEGSTMAFGKKAQAIEPSVRKVLPGEEGLILEHQLDDHNVALPPQAAQAAAEHDVSAARERAAPEAGPLIPQFEHDHFVVVPPPLAEKALQALDRAPARDPLEAPPAQVSPAQDLPAQVDTEELPELSDAMAEMLQMNFPARVVKLKIENRKVRTKLDALQGVKPK